MADSSSDVALVRKDSGEIIEHVALVVDPHYVVQTQRSLANLQELVQTVLVKDRDYGHIPGIAGETLFDPGASLIIGAFNCHVGERRIISLVHGGGKTAVVLEVPIVTNTTQQRVGSGIGAASVMETKNKYRWEKNPKDYGYSDESIKTLKTRNFSDVLEYRILNPEPDELLNVVVAMASKRAEVDAAKGLPGVGSALKDLFEKRKARQEPPRQRAAPSPASAGGGKDFTPWWVFARQCGLTSEQVHKLLGVKTLIELGDISDDEFRKKLVAAMDANGIKVPQKTERDPNTLTTLKEAAMAAKADFGIEPAAALKALGYSSSKDIIETPPELYRAIKALAAEDTPPPEE